MIIAVSGKINSGKDTVGEIVQILTNSPHFTDEAVLSFIGRKQFNPKWKVKKFADKLKDMVCMLLGCTREQLEDREFKEKELGEEWWYWKIFGYNGTNPNGNFILIPYDNPEPDKYDKVTLIKPTPRLLLQLLGTECGRQIIHPNIWANALMNEYRPIYWNTTRNKETLKGNYDYYKSGLDDKTLDNIEAGYPNWVITDMRFPNELKAVEDKGGITIRVNRKPWINVDDYEVATGKKVERVAEHESEIALDNAEFGYIINNNGTLLDLISSVRMILLNRKLI